MRIRYASPRPPAFPNAGKNAAALRRALTMFLASALALLACGCLGKARTAARATLNARSEAVQEFVGDPVALSTVKTVAILPFDNRAPEPGFDSLAFGTRLANQITARGKLRVIYPQEVLRLLEEKNAGVRRHNMRYERRRMLGIAPAADRERQVRADKNNMRETVAGEEDTKKAPWDPVRNLDAAVRLGRILKADAVVMGMVTDYDPYYRPRLSLTMRVVATGQSDAAALALAELTQWGIPRSHTMARGIVWFHQQNFDSRTGNIGRDVYFHALNHHTEAHPYDTDIYLRSMERYYEFVSTALARALLKAREEAVTEAEERAVAEAARRKETEMAMRNRVRALTEPDPVLPDADAVIAENLGDRRNRDWRPDIYNRGRPEKARALYK